MSFSLPRNQRDLRFSGELRAAIEDDAPRLGVRRRRHAPSIPSSPDLVLEGFSEIEEDECPTTMMDRDAIPPKLQIKTKPIPGFRKAKLGDDDEPNVILTQLPPLDAKSKQGPPLALWLLAAMFLGLVSYKLVPAAASHVKAVTTLLDTSSSSE